MNLYADECCTADLVAALRADGHDVRFALEEAPGTPDDVLLAGTFADGLLMVSADKDFGELVVRAGQPTRGVVLLRFGRHDLDAMPAQVVELLRHDPALFFGHLTVVTPKLVRHRPLR